MASNSGKKSVGTQTPFSFGDDPTSDLNREQEAERQGRENPASGNTSGNDNTDSQQQHQNGPEDHPIVGHAEAPRQTTFQAAFSFNRGRGQSQGQSRGITYNRGPWRGGQNYSRGQSENRGGRGNAGPGRGNFAVTRYNRGGYSQNNSRGGITKSAKPVAVEKPATTVVDDKQSREHAANTSSGGGTQISASVPPKEMAFPFFNTKHIEESVRLMQQHFPDHMINVTIRAIPDSLRQIARNRQLQQSTQYTDRKYPVKKGPKENPRVEHVVREERIRCVSCGSKAHLIGFCLSIRDGELRGCPLCHDIGHLVDQCQTFLAMSLTNKVRTLVDGRARMPPLATTVPWWDYLHQWLEDEVSKNADPPTGFPWSVNFTKMVNQEDRGAFVKGRQQEFDKDHNKRSVLPYDADTSKFQSIYRKYWRSEQKSFPERIREMTGEVAPNDDFSDYKMQPIPPDFDVNAEPEGNYGFPN
ncbi:hypothetical protein HG530_005587 [Fusarium avenaceum]|nr:hypothetical protein HG530_005587 [Fusarium avenaceum]